MAEQAPIVSGVIIDVDEVRSEKFLDALNQRAKSLDAIFDDLHINLRDVARWLRDRKFRRALADILRAIRKLRDLEFDRSALLGAIKYLLAVAGQGGFKGAQHKKVCEDAYKTASAQQRRKATKIVKDFLTAQAKFRPGPGGIAHPDVAHIADRLIDELEEARREEERLGPE